MRPQQQNRRMRGRNNNGGGGNNNNNNNNNRKGPNPLTRNYESNGPDVKIRGSAQQIAEKYATLARDCHSSGDRVMAENYLQHAEHYNRIIAAAQAQMPIQQSADNRDDSDDDMDDDRDDFDNASGNGEQARQQPASNVAQGRQSRVTATGPQPAIGGRPSSRNRRQAGSRRRSLRSKALQPRVALQCRTASRRQIRARDAAGQSPRIAAGDGGRRGAAAGRAAVSAAGPTSRIATRLPVRTQVSPQTPARGLQPEARPPASRRRRAGRQRRACD